MAEPRFIPEEIRNDFTALTRIPMLGQHRPPVYSIFNDPDTGIRLPDRENQREGVTHISLTAIEMQLSNSAVRCALTYDQSNHREPGFTRADQRKAKVLWLRRQRLSAFYYVSHAPFLFAFSTEAHMKAAQNECFSWVFQNVVLSRRMTAHSSNQLDFARRKAG